MKTRIICMAITAILLFSSAFAMTGVFVELEPEPDVSEITCILLTKKGKN